MEEVAEPLEAASRRHGRTAGGRGLRVRAAAKLAEAERKIADLEAIRRTLVEAMDAGCDDLVACAGSAACGCRDDVGHRDAARDPLQSQS